MGFDRNNRGGFNRRNFNDRGFGGRDSQRTEMFQAVCDNCGRNCEVPFRPTNGRPIYCSDCFEKNRGGDSRSSGERSYDRPRFNQRVNGPTQPQISSGQLEELNSKLDKILSLLEPAAKEVKVEKKKKAPKKAPASAS